ncbi:MAG TPA: molybdate ABC transporter substrate-binding protein [Burkholderiales bacterium]|jgi:molybdate transport system substrate-binding protein|nr:molybdate ABC transporter substrate-binding protein [Burkholderiales bacterium]
MRTLSRTAFAVITVFWIGCAAAADLVISAATSLTNAFTEIGKEFDQSNPGQKAVFNFAGSGALLQQIARGAPVDVFASADQETMDRAAKQNLIVGSSRADFVRNTLVAIGPKGTGSAPKSFEDLKNATVTRLAISNPASVPAGRYAREALEAAGLWDAVKAKALNTRNVRQSLDYVARGEADAGFVYRTDVAVMANKVEVLFEVPTRTPILYPIAAVKGNGNENNAMKFIDYVRSDAGQRILAKYGFRKP